MMYKQISVIIPVRDYDPSRLDTAIRSHISSSIGTDIELIVSDYGSTDTAATKEICAKYGCTYVYTEADIWSRSRALNAGLSVATSDFMVTTDADIVFAPRTLEATVEQLSNDSRSIVLAQCSDLGEKFSLSRAADLHWADIYADATLRPRWGMGGLCAFDRDTLDTVRGFEERMLVWGAEDNDFVKRCRQSGRHLHWLTGTDIGIYHVWHPRFLDTGPQAQEIFQENKKILTDDMTTARNYLPPVIFTSKRPLVSVNIAAYNRGHLIGEAIQSVLNQTVQDIEILVYDDASEDNTAEVVESFDDSRVRCMRGETNGGVAHARNAMIAASRGQYICIHDDDDIMLPNRIELQLDAMTAGEVGNYGGWIDFDADTGDLSRRPGKAPFGIPSVCFVGSVFLHPTLMVQTEVLRRFGYNESFRGGSDFNLAFRIANAGYKLGHCGDYLILRRVHMESLTGQSQEKQKLASGVTVTPFLNSLSSSVERELRAKGKKVSVQKISPTYNDNELKGFLPPDLFDHVVECSLSSEESDSADVSLFSSDGEVRHFAYCSSAEVEKLAKENGQAPTLYRVPKRDDDPSGDPCDVHDGGVVESLCEHFGMLGGPCVATVECVQAASVDVSRSVDLHANLIDTVGIFKFDGKSHIIVSAGNAEIARFGALSLRSAISRPPVSGSCASTTVRAPEDTATAREIH